MTAPLDAEKPERITFKKACRCRSSASGPRLIFREEKPYTSERRDLKGTNEVIVEYVMLACDECDTAWRRADGR